MTPRLSIEHFHLTFCRLLCSGADRADFAIKGGCNLRFFFGSVRYSEDLDLDVQRVPTRTLRGRVDKLLTSPLLLNPLRSMGIELVHVSSPKQTDTTQRWKVSLRVEGASLPVPTKIEFSRRDDVQGAVIEPVDRRCANEHRIQPALLPHYPASEAIQQKVRALVGRTQVQARDVFDLSVLLARTSGSLGPLASVHELLPTAANRAMDVSFDDFSGQVVPYLEPAQLPSFASRAAWDAIQLQVVDAFAQARGHR